MTTYAAPQSAPTRSPDSSPSRRQHSGSSGPLRRPRHYLQLTVAAIAFITSAGAVVGTAAALLSPMEPGEHTVNVASPPAPTLSSAERAVASRTACSAWDQAARWTATASRASANSLSQSWRSPESTAALAMEKRTGVLAAAYLRTQMDPATPANIAVPINDWINSGVDMLHALNMRDWSEAARIQEHSNTLIDPIVSACGLG